MRLLFFILLLANAVALGYFMYREQHTEAAAPNLPDLNAQQIKIRIDTDNPAEKLALQCWQWRGLTAEEILNLQNELGKSMGDKLIAVQTQEFWLHIPPLRNKLEADKKMAELERLGITEATLVEEAGQGRYALSFGVYSTEDEAVAHLNQLKEKGVKTAKIVQRDAPVDGFLINRADEPMSATIKQVQTRYPNSELKPTDCPVP